MRKCARCQENPATSERGLAVCVGCRRPAPLKVSTRTCYHCGGPPTNGRGKPLCAACREKKRCTQCGKRTEDKYVGGRCEPCNVARNANRPQVLKKCKDCDRWIRSKSNSNYCAPCQHRRKKHPCLDCDTLVDGRATRCSPCWGKRHRGEYAPTWKGGRTLMLSHGYVLQHAPGHPKASGSYVRQHVLVMEEMLGRHLVHGENVHHLNGQRDDNRPENLELWNKVQPAGQRVVDKVAWAKELLALYEPEALAQPVTPAA